MQVISDLPGDDSNNISIYFSYFYLFIYLFLKYILKIYLFMAALGLHCCARAFSSCREWGLLFLEMHRLLIVVASLVAEHGLQMCRLSSCGTRALECRLSSCGAWA